MEKFWCHALGIHKLLGQNSVEDQYIESEIPRTTDLLEYNKFNSLFVGNLQSTNSLPSSEWLFGLLIKSWASYQAQTPKILVSTISPCLQSVVK